MKVDLNLFYAFLLLLVRASFFVFFCPVVGGRGVPAMAKIGLALMLSVIFLKEPYPAIPTHLVELVLVVLKELILGAAMGFSARLVFDGIQLGGQYVGYMMGLSIVNVMDPQAETAVPLISHFENLMAILVFLSIGGHLWFMEAYSDSLRTIPIGSLSMGVKWAPWLFSLARTLFVIAIKVNAPIFIVMFLIQIVLAISARVVPQMNIFMVGFPLQIFVGLLLLAASLKGMVWLFSKEFANIKVNLYQIMRLFSG